MAISLGRALTGLTRLSRPTFNSVYRGDVLLENGERRRGFIKDLDPIQLASELLVAALAERTGIPVPPAALVAVEPKLGDFREIIHKNGIDHIAFCSMDLGGVPVAQIVNPLRNYHSVTALRKSPWLGNAYGFDTWVANVDRNTNNVLLGSGGVGQLIDHGHCFTGPNWEIPDLDASRAYLNKLRSWLTPCLSDGEKTAAMVDVTNLVSRLARVDVAEVVREALFADFVSETRADAVTGFLEARTSQVAQFSAEALEVLV